jgi:NAD(P)-dependent dehydrogenase (short-subunit alcohol dehydrogenase family)
MISVVTGVGSRGQVGEAVAGALARRGDHVLLVSRSAQEVEERARELRDEGYSAHGYGCDLSDLRAVDALVARVRSEHGDHIDALVNLAGGFGSSGPISRSDPPLLDRMFAINAKTAYVTTRAFFPLLQGTSGAGGSIVFFASEVVVDGVRSSGVAAYAMSKAAVVALMRSIADEGRALGIRANALAPAAIRTASNESSMKPDSHFVEREDVASAVAFLCSPAATAISGQTIWIR